MPKYTLKDIKTLEEWDVMCSYEQLQVILDETPNTKQVLKFPSMVTQSGSTLSKTSSDWRDHLKRIDKAAGKDSKVHT